jgi:hypothetical protein
VGLRAAAGNGAEALTEHAPGFPRQLGQLLQRADRLLELAEVAQAAGVQVARADVVRILQEDVLDQIERPLVLHGEEGLAGLVDALLERARVLRAGRAGREGEQ